MGFRRIEKNYPVECLRTELDNEGNEGRNLREFSFACVMNTTNNFSAESKLGGGGFGPVYKVRFYNKHQGLTKFFNICKISYVNVVQGKLPEGQQVAIKRLARCSGQGLTEFKNELILIAKLQHMNLVRLLGYCIQEEEKMLIYEYMPNKSLDFFLFGKKCLNLVRF